MNKKLITIVCALLISSGYVFASDFNFNVGNDLGYSTSLGRVH